MPSDKDGSASDTPAARDGSPGAGRLGDGAVGHEASRGGRGGQGGARGPSGYPRGGRGGRGGRGPRGMQVVYGMPAAAYNGAMPPGQYFAAPPYAAFYPGPPLMYGMPGAPMMGYQDPLSLPDALCRQIEYYFSVQNLCKDLFLRAKMNDDGWIPLHVIAAFNRVKALTTDLQAVHDAVASSAVVELQGALPDTLMRARASPQQWVLPAAERDATAHVPRVQPTAAPEAHAAEEDVFALDEVGCWWRFDKTTCSNACVLIVSSFHHHFNAIITSITIIAIITHTHNHNHHYHTRRCTIPRLQRAGIPQPLHPLKGT